MTLTRSFSYFSSLVTVIGRSGLTFMGINLALTAFGLSPLEALIISLVLLVGVFTCYGAIFTKQTLRLFSVAAESLSTCIHPREQEELSYEENKPCQPLIKSIKATGWGIGIVTALVECVATFDGWYAFMDLLHVPPLPNMLIAGTLGGVSVIGWTALVGFPTGKVFGQLFEKLLCISDSASTEEKSNKLLNGAGHILAFFTAIGAGSVGFFVIETALTKLGFANVTWPCYTLAPFVFTASWSLYMVRLPIEANNMVYLPKFLKEIFFKCDKNTPRKIAGATAMAMTGTSTFLLTYSSTSSLLERLGVSSSTETTVAQCFVSSCMSVSAMAISGREGFKLLQSPSQFLNPPPEPARVIAINTGEGDEDDYTLGEATELLA